MYESRRVFLGRLGAGVAVVPLASLVSSAHAATQRLAVDDPTAQARDYSPLSEDAARRCRFCQFYNGDPGFDWGPCVIFPGKLVSADGVCNAWYQRAG